MKTMSIYTIVPDIVNILPESSLQISYGDSAKVISGNELRPDQVTSAPDVRWDIEGDSFYTLIMFDPDAPDPKNPKYRGILHWLVGNIPGNKTNEGETICSYLGSGPPVNTSPHRYIFLVYKQESLIDFSAEPRIHEWTLDYRLFFSSRKFARKYNLREPVAANFFVAQWDESVPEHDARITISSYYKLLIIFKHLPVLLCSKPISLD